MTYIVKDGSKFTQLKVLDKYLEGHHGYIAGGVFKDIFSGQPFRDVDIWFKNEDHYAEGIEHYQDFYDEIYESDNAVGFDVDGIKVELISTVMGTVSEVLDRFDFTVAKFAYGKTTNFDNALIEEFFDHPNEILATYHPHFFEHLTLKHLHIETSELRNPLHTFERALKYSGYGYLMPITSKAQLISEIRALEEFEEGSLADALYAVEAS